MRINFGFIIFILTLSQAFSQEHGQDTTESVAYATGVEFYSEKGSCDEMDMGIIFSVSESKVDEYVGGEHYYRLHTSPKKIRRRELCQWAACSYFNCFNNPKLLVCGFFCERCPGFRDLGLLEHKRVLKEDLEKEAKNIATFVKQGVKKSIGSAPYTESCIKAIQSMTFVVELTPIDGGDPVYATE